jgi:hypothetical protein
MLLLKLPRIGGRASRNAHFKSVFRYSYHVYLPLLRSIATYVLGVTERSLSCCTHLSSSHQVSQCWRRLPFSFQDLCSAMP